MRAVIQRILDAEVKVDGEIVGKIGNGLLVYLSVGKDDEQKDAEFMGDKLVELRIFNDEAGKMNRSVVDCGGRILLVSNFTLHGDCRKGRRPSFDGAGEPQRAKQLYEKVIERVQQRGVGTSAGIFGAHMHVSCVNDGPVTFWLDSKA